MDPENSAGGTIRLLPIRTGVFAGIFQSGGEQYQRELMARMTFDAISQGFSMVDGVFRSIAFIRVSIRFAYFALANRLPSYGSAVQVVFRSLTFMRVSIQYAHSTLGNRTPIEHGCPFLLQ